MMNRDKTIRELHNYFQVRELVCEHTFSQWGERSWQFLATEFLAVLLVIRRDIIQAPMFCNYDGATQRGLRCNLCKIVKDKTDLYLSSHVLGQAGDFTIKGMTAEEARRRIKEMQHLLPCPIRMEKGVSWLHIDVLPQYGIDQKVYEFSS